MRRALVLCLFVVAVGKLSAAPERTHDITPADYASVNTITEIALSPDGKQVAYCLATWDKKSDRRSTELWVVDTDGKGKPQQLTTDRAGDRHPKWSADGKSVYVVSNRGAKAKSQVWRVPLEGKPEAVTSAKGGVIGYDYAPKADAVFYTVDDTVTDKDEFAELRQKFAKIDYGHGKRTVSKLFRIDPKAAPQEVLANNRYIREFAVTQDGKRVAMVSALDDTVIRSEGESRVDVWEDGKVTTPPTDVYRAKAASPHAWLEGLAWSLDGTRYAFCAIFDAYPAEVVIGTRTADGWKTEYVERAKDLNGQEIHVRGYGSPLKWTKHNILLGLSESKGSVGVFEVLLENKMTSHITGGFVTYAFDIDPTGRTTVALRGDTTGFPELYVGPLGQGKDPLTDLNPHTTKWKLPTIEHLQIVNPRVGGPLELPYGWKRGDKPLPLVVAIHGGPTTASYNDQRFDPHNGRLYFAAKGYAVLCPNYRGSTGYGDKFVTDLIGQRERHRCQGHRRRHSNT